MTRPLPRDFQVEVNDLGGAAWHALASSFADANIYQLWQLAEPGRRAEDVSRLVLKQGDDVVAAAELRLFRVPLTRLGVAYLRWGPMWKRAGRKPDPEHFRLALRAVRNEYVERRGMVLRLNPRLFVEEHAELAAMLSEEGYAPLPQRGSDKTLIMALSPTLEQLRAGMDKKWRNCLSKAEREGLTLASGTSDALFGEFATIYDQMLQRKQFAPTADFARHRRIQAVLPDHLKMDVIIARHEGQPCAGAVYSAIGDTALYLFGATNDIGMRTSGSYLVQWEVLNALKRQDIREYDLHGINPEANPGTYRFKQGLAGKGGREATFTGPRQSFEPSLTNYSLLLADRLRGRVRQSRANRAVAAPRPQTPAEVTAGT
jgi:hypothetical protein